MTIVVSFQRICFTRYFKREACECRSKQIFNKILLEARDLGFHQQMKLLQPSLQFVRKYSNKIISLHFRNNFLCAWNFYVVASVATIVTLDHICYFYWTQFRSLSTRVEVCHHHRDRRSCKICTSCVNFPGYQCDVLHNLRRTTIFTHTKCDFVLKLLKLYTLS